MNKFFRELQRRNVFKASISYVALSWVLLEAADIIFPIIGINELVLKYLLIVLIVAFPFWVVFAYIFDWTPSGFKKTSEVDIDQSVYKQTGKRLNTFIVLGLSLAVILLLTDRIFNVTGNARARDIEKSIAILPFTNMSNDPDQEYFSDGLTDDVLTQLAKIEEFRVISRTSVMQYKHDPPPVKEIARELNVGLVLEGSVQTSGNQIRITAQLINAKTDEHLWAESYDRPLADLFTVQRELALAIAEVTRATVSPSEQEEINAIPTGNMEAYQLYQRGRYYMNQPHYSVEEWKLAIEYFSEASEHDPDFAEAYGQLTRCHSRLYYLKTDRTPERKLLAEKAAEKALSLDGENPEILLSIGYYQLWAREDKVAALSFFERAAEQLNNNVEVLKAKGSLYEPKGEWNKYISTYEKAVEISPLDVSCLTNLAFGYYFTHQYELAHHYNGLATNLAPSAAWNHLTRAFVIFCETGANDESRRAIEKMDRDHNWYLYAAYYQELCEGNLEEALSLLETYPNGIDHKMTRAPQSLMAAPLLSLLGREEKAKDAYLSALLIMKEEIKTKGDDSRCQSALGLAYAGSGYKDEAIEAGKKAIELLPLSKDAFYGVSPHLELALIYDVLGETERALDHLEIVLSIPNYFSVTWLEQDLRYHNIRSDSRYEELLSKYAVPVKFDL